MSAEPYIEVVNLLPLSRYAQIMGLDLGHLMQVGGNGYHETPVCSQCWTEAMRQQLRLAIASAEEMIAQQLGFPVGATYIVERQKFPWRYEWDQGNHTLYRKQLGRAGWPTIQTQWKKLLTVGSVTLDRVDFTFRWICPNDAGVNTVGEITVPDATGAIDMGRIRVFHTGPTSYFTGDPWQEIEGLRFRRMGANIVIDGFRPMWVKPDACGLGDACLDYDEDANFVGTANDLDVFEEADQPEDAMCYIWAVDEDECATGGSCEETSQRACVTRVDPERGVIQGYPASWDGTTLAKTDPTKHYPPDWVIVRYRAGWTDPLRRGPYYAGSYLNHEHFGSMMAMAIVRLTNTLLPAHIRCGCKQAQEQWQNDRLLVGQGNSSGTTSVSRPILLQAERNPLGPTYGALAAWQAIMPTMTGGAVVG